MDDSRFDKLTRELSEARSRRSVLRALGGALIGALGVSETVEAAARRRLAGALCRKGGDCTSDECGPKDEHGRRRCLCASESDCKPPRDACHSVDCTDGECVTTATVDFQTDPTNCGRCGRVCQSAVCSGGVCQPGFTSTAPPTTFFTTPPLTTFTTPAFTTAPFTTPPLTTFTTPGFTTPPLTTFTTPPVNPFTTPPPLITTPPVTTLPPCATDVDATSVCDPG